MSEQDDDSGVRVEQHGDVAVWILDRPDRMNALSRAMVRRLGRLAREASDDEGVRAVVITGAGDKAFSAGADLKERRHMSEEEVRDFLSLYRTSFGAIDRASVPMIAAINGVAFGGGLELALACDLRVMAPGAQVGLTEVSLGIIPGAGGTQRLTRLLGEAKAKELVLLSERIDAQRAWSLGLVSRIAGEGETAVDHALGMARPLAEGAPIAITAALEAIDAATELPLEAGLTRERECYERTLVSSDRLEALTAFKEKRKPVFEGK